MANSSIEVSLPHSVGDLINKICVEKCLPPPDVGALRLLSTITEASAIEILCRISSSSKIRTFSGYIIHMVKTINSAGTSSSNNLHISPRKRSPPSSPAPDVPQKCACYSSPNSKKVVESPSSSSKLRTIPQYFLRSPNGSYYSTAPKQSISSPSLNLEDANPNTSCALPELLNATYNTSTAQKQLTFSPCSSPKGTNPSDIAQHVSYSPNATDHVSRVQKQLTFPPGSSSNGASPSNAAQHTFDSPNASHLLSPVQMQHSLSLLCSSEGVNQKRVHFSDSPIAIHHSSSIQKQHTMSLCSSSKGATPGNIFPRAESTIPNYTNSTSSLAISQQVLLLSELEFRKSFMVYSYVGRKKLEDVVSVEDAIWITSMKNVPMLEFEAQIWVKYGMKFCAASDRAMHFDWDSGKTYLYYCYMSADGSYQLKGPYLNTTRTHLQRELGDDNVLIVKFADDPDAPNMPSNYCNWSTAYKRIAGGISVGLRHYRLFAFKDGRDNKNLKVESTKKSQSSWAVKCFFVRQESHAPWQEKDPYILFKKTSHEARCLFMHVHMVSSMAKYISRCSLALSNSTKLRVDLVSVQVERIEDIPCRDENGYVVCDEDGEPLIHTDGTGFISEDLAILCAKDFIEAKGTKDDSFEFIDLLKLEEESSGQKGKEACIKEPPLLVQCRLFKEGYAVKGTLLVNKKLKARTIQIRPSMIKVEKDSRLSGSKSFNSLEIVSISRRPRKANLSKNLIALLSVGGVPKEYFLNLLETTLQDAQKVSSSMRAAVRVGLNYGNIDDSATSVAMIGAGIPLDEPYLQHRLSFLTNQERKGLRSGRIPISESFYLIGTADPTGTLNSDEVCIILENGQISGKVLVYRNPGLHFGDIHIVNAKYVEALEDFVGNAKYGIFFSTKGRRSVGTEIANGDFDGDLYWVSRSPQLLHYFQVNEPWKRIHSTPKALNKKPSDLSPEDLENEIITLLFATQKQNMVAGKAADSWMAFMDQFLSLGDDKHWIKEKMLKLVDLYYDALDAPKSGKTVEIPKHLMPQQYPHFLEKKIEKSYHSSSVLGLIYDTAKAYQPENSSIQEIWKLPCFDVDIPESSLNLWSERYNTYRQEMSDAMRAGDESKNDSANIVVKKYKQMLYEAEDFATSTRKLDDIYNEAIAIYQASYNYARRFADVGKCGFAWRVAGEALCSFHQMKTPGRSIPFKLAVLQMFI